MKIATVLGTRPEIIRLSAVIRLLDRYAEHIVIHTGQNYDERLSRVFFDELNVRPPDVFLDVRSNSFAGQIGHIMQGVHEAFLRHRPDRVLILGDTNSGMAAFVARRLGIPVYHMEAGNRCYDDRVPEEVNRRVIDQCSTVLMPYTYHSRQNLLAESFPTHRVHVTGNPIKEVIDQHSTAIADSSILTKLGVEPGRFILVTAHRSENVDHPARLRSILAGLEMLYDEYAFPIIVSLHPRTRSKLEEFGISLNHIALHFLVPLGFVDFIKLEKNAFCTITDSGTVQEETCIFGVPNVTIRDVTERPETLDCGSNILVGTEPDELLRGVRIMTSRQQRWTAPPEYLASGVADAVCNIVLSHRMPDAVEVEWRTQARGPSR